MRVLSYESKYTREGLNMPLTRYTTIHVPITKYLVSKYKVISDIVTQLDVDYYDEKTGEFMTRISYPTRYLRSVNTVLAGVETKIKGETPAERPITIMPIEEQVPVTRSKRATPLPVEI